MQKGALVVVWEDEGEALLTRTWSEVQTKEGRSTVFVEGSAERYALEAVRAVTIHPSAFKSPLSIKYKKAITAADKEELKAALASLGSDAGGIICSSQTDGFEVVNYERLAALENWGGRVVEFLDNFEGDYEDDEIAQEAMTLQLQGLSPKLGLVRIFPPEKNECSGCHYWEPIDGNADDLVGVCECPESLFSDQERGREDKVCEQWELA